MRQESFRGDPYRELEVGSDASAGTIKAARRTLAVRYHPDRADSAAEKKALDARMKRINAAYDLLRDPERRARYDAGNGRRPTPAGRSGIGTERFEAGQPEMRPSGPPRPRPTRPVTAHFDASELFQRRNTTTTCRAPDHHEQRPASSRERYLGPEPLRASQPNGPVERRRSGRGSAIPSLQEALGTPLEFGKFRGHTLGEVAAFEPTYIDWIARTITRDRDLVIRARVIQSDLDERGVERRVRAATPGFGSRREDLAGA